MTHFYQFSDGETIQASTQQLQQLLEDYKKYKQNYMEIDLESPEYIARANGFCDTQYSENFIESQISKYNSRINDIELWLQE